MKNDKITNQKSYSALCAAAVVAAGILWGTMGLFVRYFSALGLSSLTISGLRSLTAAVILLVVVPIIDPKLLRIRLRDWWCFFGTGVLSLLFFNYCYFQTIQASSMAVAATLLYTAPAFVMLMSLLLFGEKATWRKVIALILAIAGCVFVSGILSGGGVLTDKGILLGIGAGFGYALYSIFSRYALLRGYSSLTITVYTFLFAAAGGCVLMDMGEVKGAFAAVNVWSLIGMLVLYAMVTTVGPYLLYTVGLTGVENSKASVMASIEPVTAAVLGFAVFGELPDLYALIGIVLVLSAVVLLSLRPRKGGSDT